MISLLVLLPALLVSVPVFIGWALERVRENAFNSESKRLPDRTDREFWLYDSVVTHLISELSEAA